MATPAVNGQNMIQEFWRKRQEEIEVIEDFRERAFPMTRLRKLICAEKGKMMMSFDTPSFLTKVSEIFVQEITFRAWMCAMSHNRGIIVDSDIAEAIASTQSYDFLKDVLLDNQEEHKSEPCPNPTKKCRRGLEDHPCTSQQQLPPHQYQMPHFSHQLTSCPSYVSIPPPLPPTNVHDMTLPLPFLPQEVPALMETTVTLPTPIASEVMKSSVNYMSGDLGSFQNHINNNVSDFGVINPLQVLPGAPPYIPNDHHFMSMVPSTCEYDIGSASTSIVAAQNGGMAFHSPCNIPNGLQLSYPSTVANNIVPISTNITELDNTLPEVIEAVGTIQAEGTPNTYGMIDFGATICVTNSQQQHQEGETFVDPNLNNVDHESLDAEVATTDVDRNSYDISLEEFDMVDDSLLDEYWDAFLLDRDPSPWLDPTCTGDVLPPHIDMPDLQGFNHEPHLLDAIVRGASTGSR
ncbi:hypothetical protein BS78_08G094100 [Paspalum vaginatum]|nr:hypothetical protein BS78_08G094100 [Paspalum vaginatum]KAJ1265678.1 hypothetical protein BS78_08G094100 [Paspalum vaginatum]KAJ1265679.1 hypothetical protein BS78_08G094100 [Paspalum vaginatum]